MLVKTRMSLKYQTLIRNNYCTENVLQRWGDLVMRRFYYTCRIRIRCNKLHIGILIFL